MAKVEKLPCLCCGKEKAETKEFYLTKSRIYDDMIRSRRGRMLICKSCFFELYDKFKDRYQDELRALYHLCMMFDICYDAKLAMSSKSQQNTRKDKHSLLKNYVKNINSSIGANSTIGKTSLDSEHIIMDDSLIEKQEVETKEVKKEKKNKIKIEEDCDYENMKIPSHIKKRWGSGYSNEEYMYLEDNYEEFYDAYSHETPAERMLLMNITKSLLEAERSRKAGKTKEYENMMKLVSSMLTDANIKPSQKKNKGDEVGECFGTFIENIEKNEPIGEAIEEFADADGIGRLFERQFVKNFAKVFGLVGDDNEDED